MTYQRLPYEDASTTSEMASDCAEVGRVLPVPGPRAASDESAAPAPGLVIPDEIARMAAGLQVHLD